MPLPTPTARGETWERAALIKARAAAGDPEVGTRFLDDLTAVVWRPELDFWTIRDILEVKRKINAHRGSSRIGFLGHNIKVGRGGIREIEFFTQTQQLIHGGRDPYLRCQRTVDALTTLAEAGRIDDATADAMIEAYEFLRQLEHRLQMVGDRQTQTLPADGAGMARIADFMGFEELDDFRDLLFHHLHNVESRYGRFFQEVLGSTEVQPLSFAAGKPDVPTRAALQELGFGNPDEVFRRLHAWHEGTFSATKDKRSLTAFRDLLANLAAQIGKLEDPDGALDRVERFLATTSEGALLFPLLSSNPPVVALLVGLISTAPALADEIARRPDVLQTVLTAGFFDVLADRRLLLADCAEALRPSTDVEALLKGAQNWANDYRFQVAANTMRHAIAAVDAGHTLSDITDAMLQQTLAWLLERLGSDAGSETHGLAIVAYGALGAREMTARSLPELLFVCEGGSEGTDREIRIARRFTTLLMARTVGGCLCRLDLGPCPWGERGPLVMTVDAFGDSIASANGLDRWLAVCSARVVAGPRRLGERIDEVLSNALTVGHDVTQRIAPPRIGRFAGRPEQPGALDVRYRPGGLADLDAMLRWLQLRGAERHVDVHEAEVAPGLAKLARFEVLDEARARRLVSAHQLLREVENISAVALGDQYDTETAAPGFRAAVARAGGANDFAELQAMIETAAREITALAELIAR